MKFHISNDIDNILLGTITQQGGGVGGGGRGWGVGAHAVSAILLFVYFQQS